MFKLIGVLAVGGFLMLLVATGVLAWLNWSSRLYMPLLTAVVVGTATAFFSIIGSLKASVIKDSFASPVLVYRDAVRAPVAIPRSMSASRRIDLVMLLGQLNIGQNERVNTEDIFNISLEAVQYAMFKMIAETHRGGWAVGSLRGANTAFVHETPDVAFSDLPSSSVKEALKRNRFASLPSEEFYWQFGRFPMPPGTTVELLHIPSSPQTGVEKRSIRFVKPRFFKLSIEIESLGLASGIPADLEVDASDRDRTGTLNLKIIATAEFEALTAGNQRTEQYKAWATWLIDTLHARLAT
jgi:hypothetical protein